MLLSVVIVNWNSREDLRACLASLRGQTHRELEIIVVDNGSSDGSSAMVAEWFPECVLLCQGENLGFAEACNRGITASCGPWVAMLNNDTVAGADWAHALVSAAEQVDERCGMLQSLLLYQDRPGIINSTGIDLTHSGGGRDRHEGQPQAQAAQPEEIFCPTAGAAAYRRSMLEAIRLPEGYFDRSHFMYYEDLDLGWRARLCGWSARYVPESVVLHKWHGSSDRHGPTWLMNMAGTNRIRTLCKNASPGFVARTLGRTFSEGWRIVRQGRISAAGTLLGACARGLLQRSQVTRMARVDRRALERAWVRPRPTRSE